MLCSSPDHVIDKCPAGYQFLEFIHEQVQQAQTQQAQRLGNDPYSSTYNPGWKNHPNFSWKTQAMDNPVVPKPNYQNQPYR